MAGMEVPHLDPNSVQPAAARLPYISEDTTQGAQGGAALAQAGAQVGQAISESAGQLYGVAMEAKKNHDQSIALGKFAAVSGLTNKLLKDPTLDPNGQPQGALFTKEGQALGITDKVLKKYDQSTAQMARDLTDKEQRAAFASLVVHHRATLAEALAAHEGSQLQTQDQNNFNAGLQATISNAGLMWQSTQALETNMGIGIAAIVTRGQRMKLTSDEIQKAVTDYRTEIVSAVVKRAAQSSGPYAKALYERYAVPKQNADGSVDASGLINGEALQTLYPVVKTANVQEAARTYADAIRQAAPRDIAKQRDMALKIKDTDVSNATIERLQHQEAIDDKGDADKLADISAVFYQQYMTAPAAQRSLGNINPTLVALTRDNTKVKGAPQFYAAMEAFDREQKLHNFSRPPSQAEMATLGQFILDIDQKGPLYQDWNAGHVISLLGGKVPDGQLQHAIAALQESQKSEANRDPTHVGSPIIEQMVIARGHDNGLWNPQQKRDLWTPQQLATLAYVSGEVRKTMAQVRGLPPLEQQKRIGDEIARVMAKGKVEGSGLLWDSRATRAEYMVNTDWQAKGYEFTPKVDDAQRARVQSSFAKLFPGRPALSDDQVQAVLKEEARRAGSKQIQPPGVEPVPNLGVYPMPAPVGPLRTADLIQPPLPEMPPQVPPPPPLKQPPLPDVPQPSALREFLKKAAEGGKVLLNISFPEEKK